MTTFKHLVTSHYMLAGTMRPLSEPGDSLGHADLRKVIRSLYAGNALDTLFGATAEQFQ